jgi:hypothetical protein
MGAEKRKATGVVGVTAEKTKRLPVTVLSGFLVSGAVWNRIG